MDDDCVNPRFLGAWMDLICESTGMRYYCIIVAMLFVFLVPVLFASDSSSLDEWDSRNPETEALTFISCPNHLLSNLVINAYKSSIMSWLMVHPDTRVVLFVNPTFENETRLISFFQERFDRHRTVWTCDVKRDVEGVPFVNDLLVRGSQLARTRFLCFMPMDTVVDEYWYEIVMKLLQRHAAPFGYVTGQSLFVHVNASWLSGSTICPEALFSDLKRVIGKSHCSDQIGNDYFVWRNDPPVVALSIVPEFRIGGFFYDQYMNSRGNAHSRAVSMGMQVPVYRIENIRGMEITDKGRIYHNARLIHERNLYTMAQTGFPTADNAVERLKLAHRPLIQAPHCRGTDPLPIVHL
jgi:hypothetical protein